LFFKTYHNNKKIFIIVISFPINYPLAWKKIYGKLSWMRDIRRAVEPLLKRFDVNGIPGANEIREGLKKATEAGAPENWPSVNTNIQALRGNLLVKVGNFLQTPESPDLERIKNNSLYSLLKDTYSLKPVPLEEGFDNLSVVADAKQALNIILQKSVIETPKLDSKTHEPRWSRQTLSPLEAIVIIDHYGLENGVEKTIEQIAQEWGMEDSDVTKAIVSALDKLTAKNNQEKIAKALGTHFVVSASERRNATGFLADLASTDFSYTVEFDDEDDTYSDYPDYNE
jgi:hypothetical protein